MILDDGLLTRAAICCGWKATPRGVVPRLYWESPDGDFLDFTTKSLPNYLEDHNAMAEARRTLTPSELRTYGFVLHDICVASMKQLSGSDSPRNYVSRPRWVYDTTPREQCWAFLVTKAAIELEDVL